jgi:hypothetical protein
MITGLLRRRKQSSVDKIQRPNVTLISSLSNRSNRADDVTTEDLQRVDRDLFVQELQSDPVQRSLQGIYRSVFYNANMPVYEWLNETEESSIHALNKEFLEALQKEGREARSIVALYEVKKFHDTELEAPDTKLVNYSKMYKRILADIEQRQSAEIE